MEKLKEFLLKPVYKSIKVWHIALFIIIIGAVVTPNEEEEETNSVSINRAVLVADWYHYNSQNMGGYNISITTKLAIKEKNGEYTYFIKSTVTDQYSGGIPKSEFFEGTLNEELEFKGEDFGERGGYILNTWDDDEKPNNITVEFEKGRGHTMIFERDS